ncbi:MAG TPA: FecR family protein [Anaerolineales bacterium]
MLNKNFFKILFTRIKFLLQNKTYRIYFSAVVALIAIAIAIIIRQSLSKPSKPAVVPTVSAPELTATLKETQGNVTARQPDQNEFTPANPGLVLQVQGQLQTGSSSTARLDLPSGTIIRVAPSSLFTLESNKESPGGLTTILNLTLGQIFIILKGGSLQVSTPSGVASVRGSYMSVLIYPSVNKIFVECLEGSCAAQNDAGSLNLTNGQKGILLTTPGGTNEFPQETPMNQNDYSSWLAISPEAKDIINQNQGGNSSGHSSQSCTSRTNCNNP